MQESFGPADFTGGLGGDAGGPDRFEFRVRLAHQLEFQIVLASGKGLFARLQGDFCRGFNALFFDPCLKLLVGTEHRCGQTGFADQLISLFGALVEGLLGQGCIDLQNRIAEHLQGQVDQRQFLVWEVGLHLQVGRFGQGAVAVFIHHAVTAQGFEFFRGQIAFVDGVDQLFAFAHGLVVRPQALGEGIEAGGLANEHGTAHACGVPVDARVPVEDGVQDVAVEHGVVT